MGDLWAPFPVHDLFSIRSVYFVGKQAGITVLQSLMRAELALRFKCMTFFLVIRAKLALLPPGKFSAATHDVK